MCNEFSCKLGLALCLLGTFAAADALDSPVSTCTLVVVYR
jgi:hypothetical protein